MRKNEGKRPDDEVEFEEFLTLLMRRPPSCRAEEERKYSQDSEWS
jgi:hypothetical protein